VMAYLTFAGRGSDQAEALERALEDESWT